MAAFAASAVSFTSTTAGQRSVAKNRKPREGSGRAHEAQLLARGGQPRWPTCQWRPHAPLPENVGVPVGAYVCTEAHQVQTVRAALMDTGRLKPHGVTRFDSRVWRAFIAGEGFDTIDDPTVDAEAHDASSSATAAAAAAASDCLPIVYPVLSSSSTAAAAASAKSAAAVVSASSGGRDSTRGGEGAEWWAVHVFGHHETRQGEGCEGREDADEDEALAALLASGEVTYVPGVRIGSPACYLDTPETRSRSRGGGGGGGGSPPPLELGTWTPLMSVEERERTMRERRTMEALERPGTGGGLSSPRWAPEAHDALARAVDWAPSGVGRDGGGGTAEDGTGASEASGAGTGTSESGMAGAKEILDGAGMDARTTTAPPRMPPYAPFTFSELFAGVGGFGVALRSLGGTAVFASELCSHARRTYMAHHGGDSTGADTDEEGTSFMLVTGDITDVCETIIPPHDLLTGGFPCQSFSKRGDQLGLDDPRGQLYKEILRVLTACRPKVRNERTNERM